MKILRFFIRKIFFKRPVIVFSTLALLFIVNYLSFTAIRSILSTYQGYQEIEVLNQKNNFIANLDPNAETDFDKITVEDTEKVYAYLNKKYTYAFQVDGFISSLNNKNDMKVTFNYINEEFYNMEKFRLSQGEYLSFNYSLEKNEIPVLIGFGLSKTYPIGSILKFDNSVINQPLNLKVVGILKKNIQRSNFYAPNSKNYYNFSIFIPVNEEFLKKADLDLQVNALMDIVLIQSTKEKAMELSEFIQKNTGLKFNFFNQQENFEFFEAYYTSSLKIISTITFILLIILIFVIFWNTLISIRLMIREFTINLLVGLSYSKLRVIFYNYFGILFLINVFILWLITAFNRYQAWFKKDFLFATYGILGLIDLDWIALLCVSIIDILIGVVVVEMSLRKIKKIPISLGVLQ